MNFRRTSLPFIFFAVSFGLSPLQAQTSAIPWDPVSWKKFFTLSPEEGTDFVLDSAAIVPGGGVPVLSITNTGNIILTSSGGQGTVALQISGDGRSYQPVTFSQRGPDGGFVYLPDGRTRFLGEEPAPGNTPERHRSRIVSWISNNGLQWTRESGIRYQPGVEDDSISSVASVIQVKDSVWRMYFVGDFTRTNGTRTALSRDWGLNWTKETGANVLRRGDVDPHPMLLTDGRFRLYFRAGMGRPPQESGVGFCDSDDGLHFDTTKIKLLFTDAMIPAMFKLDPAVIKLPNGRIVCYVGAAPSFGQTVPPKLIAAWGTLPATSVGFSKESATGFFLEQNYPNPFNPRTSIVFTLPSSGRVSIAVFDFLGREVVRLVDGEQASGQHQVWFDGSGLPSGAYVYRMNVGGRILARSMLLVR